MRDFLKKVLAIILALGFCFTSIPAGQIAAAPPESTEASGEAAIPPETISEETPAEPEGTPVDPQGAVDDGAGYDAATDNPQGAADDGSGYDAATEEYYDTSAPVVNTSADVTEAYQAPSAEPDVYTETPEYVSPSETQSMTEITPAPEIPSTEIPNEEITTTQEVTTPEETTPATKTSFIYEDPEIYVEATLSEEDALPENAVFVIKQLFEDSLLDTDRGIYQWSNELLDKYLEKIDLAQVNTFVYDMYFELDGERLMPSKEFKINLTYKKDKVLDKEAKKENVRIFHLDDNDYTGEIEAFDTNAELWVNEKGSITTAEFKIIRYRYTPFMISMLETKEEHEERLAKEEAAAEENDTEDDGKIIYMDDQTQEGEPSSDESEDLIKEGENEVETTEAEDEAEEEKEPTRSYYANWGGDVNATIILSNPAQVPDTAEVVVTPVTPDADGYNYDVYMEALNSTSDDIDYTAENTILYDIKFVDTIINEDGETRQVEYEPEEGSVKVILQFKNNQLSEGINAQDNESVTVNHLVADTEVETSELSVGDIAVQPVEADINLQGIDSVTFNTESFSVYSFTYTVDFHFEDEEGNEKQFSIRGGDAITLSEILVALGISNAEQVSSYIEGIESVTFSDESVVKVAQIEKSITAGELKEQLGLNVEYSADLSEEDISNINDKMLNAPDWAFISLMAFSSTEYIKILFVNGKTLTITVTDANNVPPYEFTVRVNDYGKAHLKKYSEEMWGRVDGHSVLYNGEYAIQYPYTATAYNESADSYRYWLKDDGTTPVVLGSTHTLRGYDNNASDYNRLTRDTTYIAFFAPVGQSLIRINPITGGSINYNTNTFNNRAIDIWTGDWSGKNLYYFYSGDNVNVTATPDSGYTFLGWYNENSLISSNATINIANLNITSDTVLTPKFSNSAGINISVSSSTMGSVKTDNGNDYIGQKPLNSGRLQETITAVSNDPSQYSFMYWTLNGAIRSDFGPTISPETYSAFTPGSQLQAVFKKYTHISSDVEGPSGKDVDEDGLRQWAQSLANNELISGANKTARVFDYENRIYQIDLTADSGMRRLSSTLDVAFILDMSASMRFPAHLEPVKRDGETLSMVLTQANLNAAFPDDNGPYYIISDPKKTSSVYRITRIDGTWCTTDGTFSGANEITGTERFSDPAGGTYSYDIYYDANENVQRLDSLNTSMNKAISSAWNILRNNNGINGGNNLLIAYSRFAYKVFEHQETFSPITPMTQFNFSDSDMAGGTRQDLALADAAVNFNWDAGHKKYAILITDGAPVVDTHSNESVAEILSTKIPNAANDLKNKGVTLITVGLSTRNVEGGSNMLSQIASDGLFYNADSGEELEYILMDILRTIMEEANVKADVTDTIDPAFYPVQSDGTPIEPGAYDMNGNSITATPESITDPYYIWANNNGTWTITLKNQTLAWGSNDQPGWKQSFFIKAKEDFLGGNKISTNAGEATIKPTGLINGNNEIVPIENAKSVSLETPYVNVDELEFTEHSSSETVALGAQVHPKQKLNALFALVAVKEVVSATDQDHRRTSNSLKITDTGFSPETYLLSELPVSLTGNQWNKLYDGETISIPYSAYGHSNVGSIEITLSKSGVPGAEVEYNNHKTKAVGTPAETYKVYVKYVPSTVGAAETYAKTTPHGSAGSLTDNIKSNNIHNINVTTNNNDDYSLIVSKEWRDADHRVIEWTSPIEFQLLRHEITNSQADTQLPDSQEATIHFYDPYNTGSQMTESRYADVLFDKDGVRFHVGDTVRMTYSNDWAGNDNTGKWSGISNLSIKGDWHNPLINTFSFTIIDPDVRLLLQFNSNAIWTYEIVSSSSGNIGNAGNGTQTSVLRPSQDNGYEVDPNENFTFTLEPGSTVTFTNLPYTDGDTTYTYEVRETSTGEFTTTYSPSATYNPAPTIGSTGQDGTITIINTNPPVVEPVDITVAKAWKDGTTNQAITWPKNDQNEYSPAYVTVKLQRRAIGSTGAFVDVPDLNPQNIYPVEKADQNEHTTVTFSNLDGHYEYNVVETNVPAGFTSGVAHNGNAYTVTNTKNTTNPTLVVKKVWRGVPDTTGYPAVTFDLYRVKLLYWGGSYHPSANDSDRTRIRSGIVLSEANDYTWTCDVALQDEVNGEKVGYFVIENPRQGNVDGVQWEVYGYSYPLNEETQQYDKDTFGNSDQPYNAAIIGNTGEIWIHNKVNKYIQMDIKKQFFMVRDDGSWDNVTGTQNMCQNAVLGFKVIRRVVKYDDTSQVIVPWSDYGDEMLVGYDESGGILMDNGTNDFYLKYGGSAWFFQILDNGGTLNEETIGLPSYGIYYRDGNPIPVKYQYSFRETGVYKDLNRTPYPEWQWYSSLTPDRYWDWNQTQVNHEFGLAFANHDGERIVNYQASNLTVEKRWLGIPDADEVYVKIYRYTGAESQGDSDEDFTAIIAADIIGYAGQGVDGANWQEYVENTDVVDTINNCLVLKANSSGNWTTTIKVQKALISNIGAKGVYHYYAKEIGYKKDGVTHWITDDPQALDIYETRYNAWVPGSGWPERAVANPSDATIEIKGKDNNKLQVMNAPMMDLKVEKKWLDEAGSPIDAWTDSVNFMIKQTRTKWVSGAPTTTKEEVYLTVGDSGNRVFTLHEAGQSAILTSNHINHDVYAMNVADDSSVSDWTMIISGLQRGFFDEQGYEWHCEYTIEEVNVQNSEVSISYDNENHYEIATITNTYDTEKGSVRVTKSFDGIEALPSNYTITATWKSESENTGTDETQVLTLGNSQRGDGSANAPYVWEISGIPLGNTVTFTESNYEVENHEVTVKINGTAVSSTPPSGTAVSGNPDDSNSSEAAKATIHFLNKYTSGSGILEISKTVNGVTATDKEFIFTVNKDEVYYYLTDNGEVVTTTDASEGIIQVTSNGTPVTLPDLPLGEYVVTEVDPAAVGIEGYTYTNTSMTVGSDTSTASSITVNIENEITVSVSAVNNYSRDTGSLSIQKTVELNEIPTTNDQLNGKYSFTVISNNEVVPAINKTVTMTFINGSVTKATVVNTGTEEDPTALEVNDGKVTIADLPTGSYTVSEDTTTLPDGISLIGNNDLQINVTKNPSQVPTAAFVNNKSVPATTEIQGTKAMKGGEAPKKDAYSFTLSAESGTPMPEESVVVEGSTQTITVKNSDANNSRVFTFGTIKYTVADMENASPVEGSTTKRQKTFTYTVKEVDESADHENIVYDPAEYTVNVTVTYDTSDGSLVASTPVYTKKVGETDPTTVNSIVFTNEEVTEVIVEKEWDPKAPENAEIILSLYKKGEDVAISTIRLNGKQDVKNNPNSVQEQFAEPNNENAFEVEPWKAKWIKLPKYENGQAIYYIVKETTGQPGYIVSYGENVDHAENNGKIKNTAGSPLPFTGGSGTTLFTILGGLLILGAGAAFLIRSQRRRKKSQN